MVTRRQLMSALPALPALALPLALPAAPAAARGAANDPDPEASVGRLELKDAPVRSVLEMLMQHYRQDYSIDPAVLGTVTLTLTGKNLQSVLKELTKAGPVRFTPQQESEVQIFRPEATGEKAAARRLRDYELLAEQVRQKAQPGEPTPLRVSAIWHTGQPDRSGKESRYALLEMGRPGPEWSVYRVSVGNILGLSPAPEAQALARNLEVLEIREKGVLLTYTPGRASQETRWVPLVSISERFLTS